MIRLASGAEPGLCQEFLRIGHGETSEHKVQSALKELRILSEGERLLSVRDVGPWTRGGAETYIAHSIIESHGSHGPTSLHVLGKAPVSMARSPEDMGNSWIRRRALLERLGIRTPKLYCFHSGTIYEEYIAGGTIRTDELEREQITELAKVAAVLDAAGFRVLYPLGDLLLDGRGGLVYVDFGFDLGEPSWEPSDCANRSISAHLPSDFHMAFEEEYKAHYSLALRKSFS